MRLLSNILCLQLFLAGCAGGANTWTGSVDAVFRYRPSENSTVVHEVRKGSVSEESGLEVGDQLLAIDGDDVSAATFQEVRDALRGPVGTVARLTVKRGEDIVELTVERLPVSKKKD